MSEVPKDDAVYIKAELQLETSRSESGECQFPPLTWGVGGLSIEGGRDSTALQEEPGLF